VNLWQRLVLRLTGRVYTGHKRHAGWRGSLPHYLIECPIHGLVETYPHGFSGRLECPRCRDKKQRKEEVPAGFDSIEEWKEFKRRYKEAHGYPSRR